MVHKTGTPLSGFIHMDTVKTPNGDVDYKWKCNKCKETFWLYCDLKPGDHHECGVKELQ